MIAGMSGSQKSGLALWWAMEMNLATIYISADMDAFTATVRSAAKATGDHKDAVMRGLNGSGEGYYREALDDSRIQWCFDSAPTVDDVALELDAYTEAWDRYPEVVIVDNLMNVEAEHDNEFSGLKMIMSELHSLARLTGAAVFVLHHMTEANQRDTTMPCAKRDILGKVSQLPEVILSVALDNYRNEMRIAVVKNRNGKCDPSGRSYMSLQCVPEHGGFQAWQPAPVGQYGGYE